MQINTCTRPSFIVCYHYTVLSYLLHFYRLRLLFLVCYSTFAIPRLLFLISYFYRWLRHGHKLFKILYGVDFGIHEISKGCKLGCTFGFLPLCIHVFRNHLANNFSCFRISMHREVIFSKNSFHPQILFRMLIFLMYKWLTCNPGCLGRYCKYTAL